MELTWRALFIGRILSCWFSASGFTVRETVAVRVIHGSIGSNNSNNNHDDDDGGGGGGDDDDDDNNNNNNRKTNVSEHKKCSLYKQHIFLFTSKS
jgi:hypothetical protein